MVKVGTFTPSIIVAACRELGFFSAGSGFPALDVVEIAVKSSPDQFKALAAGELDLAITSPDNCIAYRFLKNNPLQENYDVRILSAIDRGLGLSLARFDSPEDPTHDLVFGVDVPESGFAFVGYALLKRHGIENYQIQPFGSTPKRLTALLAGECDLTMLNAGNEIKGMDSGAEIIAYASELGPYLGTVAAVIGEPSSEVTRVDRALSSVIEAVCQGLHKELILELAQGVLSLSARQAEKHYLVMTDPVHGLVKGSAIDTAALDALISLRKEYLPTAELDEISNHYKELVIGSLTTS